jgi:hypothetical protein
MWTTAFKRHLKLVNGSVFNRYMYTYNAKKIDGDPELKKEAAKVAPRQNSSGIGPSGF